MDLDLKIEKFETELTPLTYKIIQTISEFEQISLNNILTDILNKKNIEVEFSIAVSIFIMIYMSYEIRNERFHAYDKAIKIVETSNIRVSQLLRRVFIDEGVSMQNIQAKLQLAKIGNGNDLSIFLEEMLLLGYSGRH
jgi:hypothetical protein